MKNYYDTLIRASNNHNNAVATLPNRNITDRTFSFQEVAEAKRAMEAIRTFWYGLVVADRTAQNTYTNARAGIGQITSTIQTFHDAIGKNGGNVETLDIKQLQSELFKDQELFDYIADKLVNGEPLNYEEREMLYRYVQEKIFGEDDGREVRSIVDMIENDPEGLVDRINEDVLSSEADLEREIAMIELYLFTGNRSPKDHHINGLEAAKLSAYLAMLRSYQSKIIDVGEYIDFERGPNDPLLARVEYIDYVITDDPIKIRLDSEIAISLFDETEWYTREDFLDIEELMGGVHIAQPKVEYYYGQDGVNDLQRDENLQLEEEYANYRSNFIGNEAMKLLMKAAASRARMGPIFSTIDTGVSYQRDKDVLEDGITIGEAKLAAMDLDMELQFSTVPQIQGKDEFEIQLRPTDSTFEILDRWEMMVGEGANIPYPEEEDIQNQNWQAISDFLNENKSDLKISNPDIYYYIFHNDLDENTSPEDLIDN